ncbi:MAG TPA: hypothetical protein V6D46_03205 [Coleofasciculaceae cyanobacterium]
MGTHVLGNVHIPDYHIRLLPNCHLGRAPLYESRSGQTWGNRMRWGDRAFLGRSPRSKPDPQSASRSPS